VHHRRTIETREHQARSNKLLEALLASIGEQTVPQLAQACGVPERILREWIQRNRSLSPAWCEVLERWMERQGTGNPT
jgi:hypothetical protein